MKTKFYIRLVMLCAGAFLLIGITSAQQTHLEIPIVAGEDDAEEILVENAEWELPEGDVNRSSSDLEIYWDDVIQYVGVLFRDVQIPQGTTIDSAYIQFVCKSAGADDILVHIWGVDSVNVDSIKEVNYDISSKEPTTATVDWDPDPWIVQYDVKPEQRTPYLNTIVDEIVGKEGWAAGNNMMFVLTGDVDENLIRHAYSFDFEDITNPEPVLNVWFTEGSGTGNGSIPGTGFQSQIYPNPTEGRIYIDNPSSGTFSYNIHSISGSLVGGGQNMAGPRADVDLSSLSKGVYLINVISREGTETHKVIRR